MQVGSIYILTDDQVAAWMAADLPEYNEWVECGLFDPETRELLEPPPWAIDNDPTTGPFDFFITQSQGGAHW